MRQEIITARFADLPAEYQEELLELKKASNPKYYQSNFMYVLFLLCLLFLLFLSFGFMLYAMEKTPGPSGPIEGGIMANLFSEYIITTLATLSTPVLWLFMLVELILVAGKTDYFAASFALVKRLGRRITLYNYSGIAKMSLTDRKVRRDSRSQYAGSDLSVVMSNDAKAVFTFNKRVKAREFIDGINERLAAAKADFAQVIQTRFLPMPLILAGYLALSLVIAGSFIHFVLLPMHNQEVLANAQSAIFELEDGQSKLTDSTRALKNYLKYFPEGEHRAEVLQHYKTVRMKELENLAWDLVCFKFSELSQNNYMYKYRRAILLYNEYFNDNILQNEYKLLIDNKYDEWLELRRSKGVVNQQAARNEILKYRETALKHSGFGPLLSAKMSFYRAYFADDEFLKEEELLKPVQGHKQWKAFIEGKLKAEAE